jgi:CheY-like chemotaxis protein
MAKILIVDDDEDIRITLRRFLKKEKHLVGESSNGMDALKILQKKAFDIVLLDILMPEMTGIEVAKSIKANPKTKNQAIVFCSVVTLEEKGAKQIRALKPVYFINKPFELKELRAVIQKVLAAKKG